MKQVKFGMLLSGMLALAGVFGGTLANAETKVTFGVAHMCCGKCQAAAKTALTGVSSGVDITGSNVTVTMAGTDIQPVLDALRKSGFPACKVDVGSNAVTVGVAHLCCGKCKSALETALKSSQVAALDTSAITMTDDSVTIKAKAGMSLDLVPVLAAMEKGGYSSKSVTMTTKAASAKHGKTVIARAK